jgi:hypothetical protein
MSNTFKSNSRFSSLLNDNEIKIDNKNINKQQTTNRFKNEKRENRRTSREEKRARDLKDKKEVLINMDLTNFPELVSNNNKKSDNKPNLDFLKINSYDKKQDDKKQDDKKEYDKKSDLIDIEYENLMPGLTLLKRDKITGKTIIKHKPIREEIKKPEKTETEIVYETFKKLAELYEEHKREYIELWGYDEWERMYRFPNYDYEYFDKLDQKYYEELDELEEESEELENIYSDEEL